MIVIHAADIHLGSPLSGLDQHDGLPVQQLRAAPLAAFERIADLCIERDAKLLLIAGDLFDGDADMGVISAATGVLKRITGSGTKVVLIRGNHDAASKMQRRLPRIDGVTELSTTSAETVAFDDLGIAVHGRGFDKKSVTDNIVKKYPERVDGLFNIGLLHTSLEGNAAHATYAPCEVDDLVAHGYDYWALGHIHQHAIVRASDPCIVYSGSPQARHVREEGEHGVYVLDIADGELAGSPEHVELGTVQWHHLRVEVSDDQLDADGVCTLVRDQLEQLAAEADEGIAHVVRLTITGSCEAHTQFVDEPDRWIEELHSQAAAISGEGTYLEKVRLRTSPLLPPPESLRERVDVIGDLARHLAADQLAAADADEPITLEVDAIAHLDEKLRALGARAHDLTGQPVTAAELELAGEQLLAHLLVASEAAGMEDAR